MAHIRSFILNTSESYFNVHKLLASDNCDVAIEDFIHNPQTLLLQAYNDKNVLYFNTVIQSNKSICLIYYKTSPATLGNDGGLENINMMTLTEMPTESLYQILKQIYSPILSYQNDIASSELQLNIKNLESNLRSITHKNSNESNYKVILSIDEEIDYWKSLEMKPDINRKEKEAASTFIELFEDINNEINSIRTSNITEHKEFTENIGGILDDVWRNTNISYAQDRMKHVFDIIGYVISSIIQKILSSLKLWKVHYGAKDNEIISSLSESVNVIQTWINVCESLTSTYWPNYALHAWEGKPYLPVYCGNFHSRLKEVFEIRSTHSQLIKLLNNSEREELDIGSVFQPFENVNTWLCNGPNQAWQNAVDKFSANLRPAEAIIAEKLKPRLHNTSTKQMLYEFMRYATLISRPLVKRALNNELEIFVTSLGALLRCISEDIQRGDVTGDMYLPPEMSVTVQQIQWAKHMEDKVLEIQTCADLYLNEFEGSSELIKMAMNVQKDLKNMYTQLHEEWSRDVMAEINSGSLSVSPSLPIVTFSGAGSRMEVAGTTAGPRCLEARALVALGLSVAPNVSHVLDTLARVNRYLAQLHQVASFHNTLSSRLVPSTRGLLLSQAVALSRLVTVHPPRWDDLARLEQYTTQLNQAVMTLENQNSYLTSQHIAIRNIVSSLVDTELLAKQSEWKNKIKQIRDIVEQVESEGYKNTEQWRSHWDWQLYKVLECQYINTLHSLHKYFPTVKVDLVLRGRLVRVQPPLEEIRVQHYNQLRRFLCLPSQFVGLNEKSTGEGNIFTEIVDKHSYLGNASVSQLESTLASLSHICTQWTRRASLACVEDLESLCREKLLAPQDWEINFKACKAYGQAVAKMTFDDEKVDWIIVGTATLRREFEAQIRNLWSCLISTLQSSCRNDSTTLDSFIANAILTLDNKVMPKNAKELAEISGKHNALKEKWPEMEALVSGLEKKGQMLRSWGGDPSIENTIREWRKTQELMVTHQEMFQHQADIVKSSITGEWENLNMSLDSWLSRWKQTRVKLSDVGGATYDEMRQRCQLVYETKAQWEKLVQEKDELIKECAKFSMLPDMCDSWELGDAVIQEDLALWSTFKEYDEEYQSLAEQEWIVFQKKVHLIDEMISKWSDRLEPYNNITLFIQQQLDKYTDLSPLLKYVRGTDFTERHWREVYAILDINYKRPDTLVVRDFLDKANDIKKHVKELQLISTSASSESAIRSALNELELWYSGARLTITYYTDKGKQQVPIVKDFNQILGKIEEQQWVVSSVTGGAVSDVCQPWILRLNNAQLVLKETHHVQRRWLYLEPILSTDDGDLGARFRRVDQGFRQVARIIESDPRLSALAQTVRLLPMLESLAEQLNGCQSALNEYIDEKRSWFPRLYFLSDDDLLELLGQARAHAHTALPVIHTHLKKLFPGITTVKLGPNAVSVTALCSQHGESLQLEKPVDIDCPVEVWLKNLECEMRSSLQNLTLKCVNSNLLEQDPFTMPTQILCLAQNIRFTQQTEKAIANKELYRLKETIEQENVHYAQIQAEDENERVKKQALILQCVHYMDVVKSLLGDKVVDVGDWNWQKRLRFYVLNKDVVAKMGLASISYSYEYLGVNTGQFVRTELAERTFFILTQALHLGLMGNPFGPAGTGKTESIKALGGLVGRLVLVFNCDEAMDAQCMGRLLSGLAKCGSWGCFDEFNRLSAATLAAVTHQLSALLAAMLETNNKTTASAVINGKQVSVSAGFGVMCTLNPASVSYRGRRSLPPSLSACLAGVAVGGLSGGLLGGPPSAPLAAPLLALVDPRHHWDLAYDLHQVFALARELLTRSHQYDWGLRAVKAAIGSCVSHMSHVSAHPGSTAAALRRVLRLNNTSKLTHVDAQRFEAILSLVFSDVPKEDSRSNPIMKALEDAVQDLGLVENREQIQKCMEVYEQLQQRMGVAIVGPPGSGKSTIRKILKHALTRQGKNVVEHIICPKAMSKRCLLGYIDHDTRQWTDGVISATALEVSNQSEEIWSWIVLDGNIDPEWVEALNSVLDDNRLLSLPSGVRIQFQSNVNFIFETHHLQHASPATVSRMGVILLSNDIGCANEYLESWLTSSSIENEMGKMALPVLQTVIKKCLDWLGGHNNEMSMKIYGVSMVKQILTQFTYVASTVGVSVMNTSPEELVSIAVHRSVLGLVKKNSVDAFKNHISCLPYLPPLSSTEVTEGGVVWSGRLVPVTAAVRGALVDNTHILLVGPPASGKNVLLEELIKETNASTIIKINCTPILEPEDIMRELEMAGVRQGGAGVVLLVTSLHRAQTDSYGTSALQSFLLQLIQYGGYWGALGRRGWRGAGVYVALTTRTTASMDLRLLNHLTTVLLREPESDELLELIENYLKQNTNKIIKSNELLDLAKTMLNVYKETSETFYSQTHYKWFASDLKRWCENVKSYAINSIEDFTMALISEANMIFRDRLMTAVEKSRFDTILRSYFTKIDSERSYLLYKAWGPNICFDLCNKDEWYQSTQKIINQCLSEHDHNVFGDFGAEVCTELATLCPAVARACSMGVCVCVGSAGVGRVGAVQVALTSLSAQLYHLHNTDTFNTQMKNAISTAGIDNNRTIILIQEQACDNTTLGIIEGVTRATTLQALPSVVVPNNSSKENSGHIITNIKQNLGIIISLDKNQENLMELFDKYPYLYKDGHVVWIDRWSDVTLMEIPPLIINRLYKEHSTPNSDQIDSIPTTEMVNIYNTLQEEWMRAPCRYVAFVKAYYHILQRKRAMLNDRKRTLMSGVEALNRARTEVSTLQEEAAQQQAALSDKQAKANLALDQISATVRAATDKKEEMHELKKKIQIENDQLQIRKKEIEAELAAVEPVIAAARAAVGDIKPEALSEVRSLRAPPVVVRDVLEGVLRLMGISDTSWHSMKTFLSRRGVREDIRVTDASQIPVASLESVEQLVQVRATSFSPAAARRASAAVAPLASWVVANVQYARALHDTKPLQEQQQELHRNLKKAEYQLSSLSSGVLNVEQRVEELKQQLGSHSRDVATLQLSLANGQATIEAATTLLTQLQREYATWERDLKHISKEISELSVRSLLAAAYVVYLPDLTEPQARASLSRWSSMLEFDDSTFDVITFLCSSELQLKWDADGLPNDKSAVKNAGILDQFLQPNKIGFTPLIVDPDGVCIEWLRNNMADTHCEFISQDNEKFNTALQYATRLGRVLVVTSSDSISPSLSSLISFPGVGVGRIMLYTRDASAPLRLHPRYRSVISVLHFTPRLDGLIDHLVHHALQHQNPEVNEKVREIKVKKATLQKEQYQMQENLLKDLSTNSDILHDTNLLDSLKRTRETSATIAEALESASRIEKEIKQACVLYELTARKTAVLTLGVKELLVQYPLVVLPVEVVLDVYVEAIVNVGRSATKLNNDEIIKYVTRRIIERVLLSVRKKDKYTVILHLLRQVYDDIIHEQLWKYLIGNTDLVEDQRVVNDIKDKYEWVPHECVRNVAILQKSCPDLFSKLSFEDVSIWKQFMNSGDWMSISKLSLSHMERAVVAVAIRPDSVYRSIVALVDHIIGAGSAVNGGVHEAAKWGTYRPILLLGEHAHTQLNAAHKHLRQTSIEDGPTVWQSTLSECGQGGWMSLVVGGCPFSATLITFINHYTNTQCKDLGPDFRLWIVTEDRDIPPAVSNCCVNVILESPEGIRNNVIRTLKAWGPELISDPTSVRRDACLAYLHAVVMERKYYVPQGWSKWWGFGWGSVAGARHMSAGGGGRGAVGGWYGGRVGGGDLPLLAALLQVHYPSDARLTASYRPHNTDLELPTSPSLQAYIDAFSSLPHIDTPQMLGLPANCRVAWERNTARYIVDGLKDLETVVTLNKKTSNDVNPLKPLLALWKKLMSGNPLIKGEQLESKVDMSGWWGCVVVGEVCECVSAVTHVHHALVDILHAAHTGSRQPIHKVPASWQLVWSGPESTARYIRELATRANSAVQRYQTFNQTIPRELDVRTVMSVSRVLSGIKCVVSQRTHTHPQLLHLHGHWDCDVTRCDECELALSGLCLQGATWDKDHKYLMPATAHSPPHVSAPTLGLRYLQSDITYTDKYYKMPIFSNETREELLVHVPVLLGPSLDRTTAILNSIALFVAPI